jgi:hypothetical protein
MLTSYYFSQKQGTKEFLRHLVAHASLISGHTTVKAEVILFNEVAREKDFTPESAQILNSLTKRIDKFNGA